MGREGEGRERGTEGKEMVKGIEGQGIRKRGKGWEGNGMGRWQKVDQIRSANLP